MILNVLIVFSVLNDCHVICTRPITIERILVMLCNDCSFVPCFYVILNTTRFTLIKSAKATGTLNKTKIAFKLLT